MSNGRKFFVTVFALVLVALLSAGALYIGGPAAAATILTGAAGSIAGIAFAFNGANAAATWSAAKAGVLKDAA